MSLNKSLNWMLCIGAVALAPVCAQAELITFTHEGLGGGSIGGDLFAPSEFVITAVGDTDDRELFPIGVGWFIDHTFASIWIDGVGSFDFLVPTRTFVNNELFPEIGVVGFAHGGGMGNDLFDGPADPAFASWDMLSSIGPISNDGFLLQWDAGPPIETTGGTLVFDTASTPVTFTAVIPAPSVLAAFSVAGLGLRRRRR